MAATTSSASVERITDETDLAGETAIVGGSPAGTLRSSLTGSADSASNARSLLLSMGLTLARSPLVTVPW